MRGRSIKLKSKKTNTSYRRSLSPAWPKEVFIWTDGACRGNPGPCSLGLQVLNRDGQILHEEALYLENNNTNNFAEYRAVIRALELAVQQAVQKLSLFSDSQLIIRQLEKKYKVKSSNLKPLFKQCQKFLKKIPEVHLKYISREQNKPADALANQALDEKFKKRK